MSVDARTGGAPVRISDVTVRYTGSDRAAVDNVSLDVAAGEFVVFLGPSGCGKSTLLRTINRLIVPDAGTIAVGDTDVAQTPPQASLPPQPTFLLLRRGERRTEKSRHPEP